jgi:GNAT superfamily N-acetyltransferase
LDIGAGFDSGDDCLMSSPTLIRPLGSASEAEAFDRLNRLWITEHFSLTAEDERVLSRPREAIVEPGGAVLVAVDEAGVVQGVVAVLAAGPGVFELAKMTVDASARGRGLGARLITAAIDWSRANGGELLFLGTNTKLGPAIRLYEAAGFERTIIDDLGLENYYARADVLMKFALVTR